MDKNRVRLTESQLRRVIKESVKKVLREGHWDSSWFDKFSEVREMVGDDTIIRELYNWLDGDSIEEFIEHMNRNYELGLYQDDEDEEYDEEIGNYSQGKY